MSHRGPRKTYPSDGVRWESDTCVTCLWETINAAVLGSPEFLCYKSPQSLIFSYCVTLCYHSKFLLSTNVLLKKLAKKEDFSPTLICVYLCQISCSRQTFSHEALHRFGSHMKPHHNHICILSVLFFSIFT